MRAVALAVLAAACTRDAQPPPARAPRLAPLAFFVGDWTAQAENPQTKQRFTLRYTVAPALGGAWLEGRGTAPALGLEVRDFWGSNADGAITRTIFDSTGVTATVSGRWSGDTLVLEGAIANGPRIRETITRHGERAFDAVWESNAGDGWSAYSVEKLTR